MNEYQVVAFVPDEANQGVKDAAMDGWEPITLTYGAIGAASGVKEIYVLFKREVKLAGR